MNQKKDLNDSSLAIINSNARRLLVRAGPGTGKTRALIERVNRLLEDGVQPEEILVLTFSRTAAADLKNKLKKLCGHKFSSMVKTSTVHAYCRKILEKSNPELHPLSEHEETFLLADLKNKCKSEDRAKQKKLLEEFKAALAGLKEEESPSFIRDWLAFYNAILIEEVVPKVLCYLENLPHTLRPCFAHILVDQYQDLNTAEQKFLDCLAEKSNFTVVGDENQSIYSFRHASPEGISKFEERHSNTEVMNLNICHRCPQKIVDMANKLIPPKEPVMMVSGKKECGKTRILISENLEKEVEELATFIKRKVDSGKIPAGEILVLARTKKLVPQILSVLKNKGVAVNNFFKIEEEGDNCKETEKFPKKEDCMLLTCAKNPKDKVAFRRWCVSGREKLPTKVWGEIQKECDDGKSFYEVLEEIWTKKFDFTQSPILKESDQLLIQRMNELEDFLSKLDDPSGKEKPFDYLFRDKKTDPQFSGTLFDRLEEKAVRAAETLKILQGRLLNPEGSAANDSVRVMSIHKSKGLAADLVIIMDCVDGQIPLLKKGDKLKEERRIFYVSITRARKILILSHVGKFPSKAKNGGKNEKTLFNTEGSRFIRELGETAPKKVDCLSSI